jgi:pSer/pThr/pTyr-binding forkhead associated (FHA) protein
MSAKPILYGVLQVHGPGGTQTWPITKREVGLGRSADNDIVLDGTGVSRHHASLCCTSGAFEITDLNSTNGTYVNHQRLSPRRPYLLTLGDQLSIGDFIIGVRPPDAGDRFPPADTAHAETVLAPPGAGPRFRQPAQVGEQPTRLAEWAKPRPVEPTSLSSGSKLIGAAAAIAIICFFMPWVVVSCGGESLASFSGWQIASGGTIHTPFGSEDYEASPWLFVVLLCPIVCLAVLLVVYRLGAKIRIATFSAIALATVSLLTLLGGFAGGQSQSAESGITMELQYGFWGSVLANVAIVLGAVLDLVEGRGRAEPGQEPR